MILKNPTVGLKKDLLSDFCFFNIIDITAKLIALSCYSIETRV